jgi:hypothetical protein
MPLLVQRQPIAHRQNFIDGIRELQAAILHVHGRAAMGHVPAIDISDPAGGWACLRARVCHLQGHMSWAAAPISSAA